MNDENGKSAEQGELLRRNIIIISAAFGIAAVLMFLGVYGYIYNINKNFYEGAGTYRICASEYDGVITQVKAEREMELNLFSNGKCILAFDKDRRTGKWSRDREKMYLVCGKLKYAGVFRGERLILRNINEEGVEIVLTSQGNAPFVCPKGLSGKWQISSAVNGDTVYDKALLNKAGYGSDFIQINYDGTGKASISGDAESIIEIYNDAIKYNGMLLSYSFDDSRLFLQYAENIMFTFKK